MEYAVEERKNEIQVMCGHFIHWFTPDKITRDKFLVFVLDVSGSMEGMRMKQLKRAMDHILNRMMSAKDYFSILTFYKDVEKFRDNNDELSRSGIFSGSWRPQARNYVNSLSAGGLTNINEALLEGIRQAGRFNTQIGLADKHLAPLVVFLTDGEATAGESERSKILENVQSENSQGIPILTLGFGQESDWSLLQGISGLTDSLSRMIFDGSDARLQLEDFFHQIERPTLSNVQFTYLGNVEEDSLSKVRVGQMFSGGEHVTVGELPRGQTGMDVVVTSDSRDGTVVTQTTLRQENFFTDQ